MSHSSSITVSGGDRCRLEALVSDGGASRRHMRRAEVILLAADGMTVSDILRRTRRSKVFVLKWQERFSEQGFEGLLHNKRAFSRNKAEIAQQGKALMLMGSMVEASSWNRSLRNSVLSELTRIERQLADVSERLQLMEGRSIQQLSYYGCINGSSKTNLRFPDDDENSFAAHVAFGMSKFRVNN
jgi:transposase